MDRTAHDAAVTDIYNAIPEVNAEYVQPSVALLARVAVLMTGSEPVWGSMRSEGGHVTEAVIYTSNRVTHAAHRGEEDLVVRAFRRTDLSALSINGTEPDQWRGNWTSVWPNNARVEAVYRDGTTLTLPLFSHPLSQPLRLKFDKFLPDLIADLDR